MQRLVAELNRLYREESALHDRDNEPDGLEWVDCNDHENSCYSFLRRDRAGNMVLAIFNFTPVPRHNYRVGSPLGGVWREIFNSDALEFGGGGVRNPERMEATPLPYHGRSHSLNVTLPPLGGVFFRRDEG
jgi:1,4-alpha-glucan branching enzyme